MTTPEGVMIDGSSGDLTPQTGRYEKRLSELEAVFQNKVALKEKVLRDADPLVYEVVEYRKQGSDVFFGTTIMRPGDVAGEFFMTRGHFHKRRDMGEVYYTQSGEGLLLLEDRRGTSRTIRMQPGVCAFIPPDWAHRSINTGAEKLVFVWVCNPLAGHDYGEILRKGMRKIVMRGDGGAIVLDNPAFLED